MIVVVDKIDQISEHQQCIGAVTRLGQRIDVAMHVGYHVDAHMRHATGAGTPPAGQVIQRAAGLSDQTRLAIRFQTVFEATASCGGTRAGFHGSRHHSGG